MKNMMKKISFIMIALSFSFSIVSCSAAYQSMVNLGRLKFKLGEVNGFTVNGISISGKSKLSDFSFAETASLTSAIAKGSLNASFILNVQALNPNDGKGGYPRTSATIQAFPYKLYIDETETISGDIASPVGIPGTGETEILPLRINLDLIKFFKNNDYIKIINLVLLIGGKGGDSSKLRITAKPVIGSPLGNITYPKELNIVNYEFR
jgi:LEA14-like dessication related protein